MGEPDKPGRLPQLLPFVVIAVALLVIYAGIMLFPTIKAYINHEDCVGVGREDCEARS